MKLFYKEANLKVTLMKAKESTTVDTSRKYSVQRQGHMDKTIANKFV